MQYAAVRGVPGFVFKLWVAHDSHDIYRRVYEWDNATIAAEAAIDIAVAADVLQILTDS